LSGNSNAAVENYLLYLYKYCIFTAKYVHEYIISKHVPLCGTGIAVKNGFKGGKKC
jgi:hypothetical protein